MIRMLVLRNITYNKAFVIWRVSPPWQPVTKKVRIEVTLWRYVTFRDDKSINLYTLQSQGVRMGSGKGNIDHYVTPVKAGQVIIEVGGDVEYFEVSKRYCLQFFLLAVDRDILTQHAVRCTI